MPYRISEASTLKGSDLTYLLVDFWLTRAEFDAGEPPFLTNDFLMELRREAREIVRRVDGWLQLLDGTFVDPDDPATWDINPRDFVYEIVQRDTRQEVHTNIRQYGRRARAAQFSGDHTGDAAKPFRIKGETQPQKHVKLLRDTSDPKDVLIRINPDVDLIVDDE